MSCQSHYILATAGHVDHGKSSLVKALTGIDPDRLPEEKARGITIELGFAYLVLPGTGPLPSRVHLGIVDVPGHEDFVKNMVTGVGSIDLALLVVAADDGWMPQTEEHLQILTYLGIQRGVVVLTKSDLAPNSIQSAMSSLREHLAGTPLAQAPIVPTSVPLGQGLRELKEALAQLVTDSPPAPDLGKPRLAIDRAFALRGIGTVVTGTLTGGHLRRGQAVILQPSGQTARIRSVQNHNAELEEAQPGTRTALSLADVELGARNGATTHSTGVKRGQIVTIPGLGLATDVMDVRLERSARCKLNHGALGLSLKDGARVRVHHGTSNTAARVLLLDENELSPGGTALAQLRLEHPIWGLAGDRFILRDWTERATLAGGVILDVTAHRRQFRRPPQQLFLRKRALAPRDATVALETQLARDHTCRQGELLAGSIFSSAEVLAAVAQARAVGQIIVMGEWVMEATWWNELRGQASNLIDAHHRAHPEQPGLPLSQLRSGLSEAFPAPEIGDTLLADLCLAGFVQQASFIRRNAHRPALPAHLQNAGTALRALLSRKPLDPPGRKELTSTPAAEQALRFLIQSGEAVELGADLVLLATPFGTAVEVVRSVLRERGRATVSDLRQAIGASRRIVVPLLERLDRDGVTRREGDWRVLRQKS